MAKIAGILLALILSAIATVAAVMILNDDDDKGSEAGTTQNGEASSGGSTGSNGSSSSGGNTGSGGSTSGGGNSSSGNTGSNGSSPSGGNTSSGGSSAHDCEYVFKSTVEVGCFTQGYDLYECSYPDCEKTEMRNFVNPIEAHDYNWQTTKNASCTEDGEDTGICKRCGDVSTKPIDKLGHDYDWKETTKATCTLDGEKTGKCKRCGDTDTQAIKKLGHDYGTYQNAAAATCSSDATQTAECNRCGDTDTKTIPNSKLEHTYGEYKRNYDSTCTEYGTKTAYCKSCGAVNTIKDELSSPYHRYGYWYDKVPATCKVEGVQVRKCSLCGDEQTMSTGYGNHQISGTNCTLCGETIPTKKGKFYINPKTSDGEGNFGTVYIEFEVLSVGNHMMTYEMYVVQSYTQNGQVKETRNKIVIPSPDGKNCGSYSFTLWSVNDNKEITFSGWIDYDVYEAKRYVSPIVGISGNSYYCTERFYLAY